MDERRALPVEKTRAAQRRGTSLWLQLLVSLIILAIAAGAWAFYYPGARETLAGMGIALPGGAPADATPSAGGAPSGAPGAGAPGRGGGGFPGRGGARAAVVVATPATSAVINDRLTAIGEGTAAQAVTVISGASGTLVSVPVRPGDAVPAGAVIATLDSEAEQIAFDRAQLAADDAAATLNRTSELQQSQSVSSVQVTAARLANDQAQLALRNAGLDLARRRIVTPIAGTVGLIQVTPGNQVTAQTVVTTVEDASEILVNFWVPERYAPAITLDMPLSAAAVALPGQAFAGTVSAIDNRIDPQSRTLQVQARIDNPDGVIRAGMSFEVGMAFPGERYASVDPLSIQWSAEGAYVWKLAEDKVHQAKVTIIERNSDGVLVSGEVAEGDQIVTQGVLQLQEGQNVRLLDAPAPGQGQGSEGSGQPARPSAQGGQGAQPAPGEQGGNGGQVQRRNGQQGGAPAAAPAPGS